MKKKVIITAAILIAVAYGAQQFLKPKTEEATQENVSTEEVTEETTAADGTTTETMTETVTEESATPEAADADDATDEVTPPVAEAADEATATEAAPIQADFTLVDQNGKEVTEESYAGKKLIVYFGFSNCPDTCPADLNVITQALNTLGDSASGFTPLFITVDPTRDTPEVLKAYLANFHGSIQGLTGTAEQIDAAKKAFGVFAQKGEEPADAAINHSGYIYVMDEAGKFVTHYAHGVTAEALAEGLKANVTKN